jgi:hypothetical protein
LYRYNLAHLHALANQVAAVAPQLKEDAAGLAGVLRLDLDAVVGLCTLNQVDP